MFCIDIILHLFYNINMKVRKFNEKKETNNETKTKGWGNRILNIALASSIAFAGFSVTRNAIVSNKQYLKPQSQVERDAELFGADLDIMNLYPYNNSGLVRLKPNDGEPIYVTIDDSIKSETLKTNINKSLDYVENIFSDINDKYKFQIVSNSTANYKKAINKTVIEYRTTQDLDNDTLGANSSSRNKSLLDYIFQNDTNNVYNVHSVIKINENYLKNCDNEASILTVLIHELLHSFGLGDVYTGNYDRLTFMNSAYGFFSQVISPNDLRILYSTYCENHIKSNGELDLERVKEIQNKIDTYEKEYFGYINNKIIQKKELNYVKKIGTLNGTFSFELNYKKYYFNIENDKVNLQIYDENKNLEKSYTGEALYYENSVTIKGFYDKTNQSNVRLYFSLFKTSGNNLFICKIDNQSMTMTSYLPKFNVPQSTELTPN